MLNQNVQIKQARIHDDNENSNDEIPAINIWQLDYIMKIRLIQ